MMENDQIELETGDSGDEKQSDVRKTRGIRFSDSEWEEVRTAAENHGVSAAEFVRDRALGIAWETEVWLCNTPEHMIHYDGERFLDPRMSR